MKFNISSTALSSRLQAISRVINSKNTLPILDCFLFELNDNTLSITASDNETTMVTTVEVSENSENGSFAIASKTILDAIKEIPEQPLSFDINMQSLEITIQYQNGKCNVVGQNADEYPKVTPIAENANHFELSTETLLSGITRTIFATADDELRPVMNGIFFDVSQEELVMVASDGHKLVRNKNLATKNNDKCSFILPKKPASLLKNVLGREQGNVVFDFDDRYANISLSNYHMVCRLIEGRFPNYNAVIPQNNPYKVTADRSALLGAIRRVSVFSSASSSLIKLRLLSNEMIISAQDIDFSTSAEEKLICSYEGEPMSIGFKANFFIDILNNLAGQDIIIELADPSRAGVIVPAEQPENEDILMLLMPMMLND